MTAYVGMTTKTIQIKGHGGDMIDAYVATPDGRGPFPGVLVIHHMPGWDEWTTEVVRRFAQHGYIAISPNLHHRAGEGTLDEVVAKVRAAGGSNDQRVIGDLQAGVDWLRGNTLSTGKVGIIGFCSGGRISYMGAAKLNGINAAVDCWGGNVTVPPGSVNAAQPQAVIDMTPEIKVPILGLFGNDDQNPAPDQVNTIEAALKQHKKQYEFHRYDGAGHGFFAWERANYRQAQAVDGWQKVFAFYEKHIGAGNLAAAGAVAAAR
jgi:carboxymethylenebutenolidase